MTTPSIVSTRYLGTSADFRHAKVNRAGGIRTEYFTAAVPGATAATTIVGLVPFQKGAKFVYGASIVIVDDLDSGTNVTISYGYIYDDAVTFTSQAAYFASASTVGQSAGVVSFNNLSGLSWVAAAQGWIAATINVQTTTTGNIQGQISLAYDQP